jgi:hypothetical protein
MATKICHGSFRQMLQNLTFETFVILKSVIFHYLTVNTVIPFLCSSEDISVRGELSRRTSSPGRTFDTDYFDVPEMELVKMPLNIFFNVTGKEAE